MKTLNHKTFFRDQLRFSRTMHGDIRWRQLHVQPNTISHSRQTFDYLWRCVGNSVQGRGDKLACKLNPNVSQCVTSGHMLLRFAAPQSKSMTDGGCWTDRQTDRQRGVDYCACVHHTNAHCAQTEVRNAIYITANRDNPQDNGAPFSEVPQRDKVELIELVGMSVFVILYDIIHVCIVFIGSGVACRRFSRKMRGDVARRRLRSVGTKRSMVRFRRRNTSPIIYQLAYWENHQNTGKPPTSIIVITRSTRRRWPRTSSIYRTWAGHLSKLAPDFLLSEFTIIILYYGREDFARMRHF